MKTSKGKKVKEWPPIIKRIIINDTSLPDKFYFALNKAIELLNSYKTKEISYLTPLKTSINFYSSDTIGIDFNQTIGKKEIIAIYSDNGNEFDFYDAEITFLNEAIKNIQLKKLPHKFSLFITLSDKTIIKITGLNSY